MDPGQSDTGLRKYNYPSSRHKNGFQTFSYFSIFSRTSIDLFPRHSIALILCDRCLAFILLPILSLSLSLALAFSLSFLTLNLLFLQSSLTLFQIHRRFLLILFLSAPLFLSLSLTLSLTVSLSIVFFFVSHC